MFEHSNEDNEDQDGLRAVFFQAFDSNILNSVLFSSDVILDVPRSSSYVSSRCHSGQTTVGTQISS